MDLGGIIVEAAGRPAETDDERFEAMRVAFLNGASSTHANARDSTELGNTYIGNTPADAVDLAPEQYADVFPTDVFNRISELTGRSFFVYLNDDGTGELAYISRGEMAIASDITLITDDGEADNADGIDIFAAYKTPQAGDHAGQNVLTGGAVRYGDGSYYAEHNVGGAEAVYDRWESTTVNDFVFNENTAESLLNKMVTNNDESNTYMVSIDMRPEDAHRIRAGMMVDLIRKRANKNADDAARAVVVTHNPIKQNPDGESWYRVDIEFGRPQFAGTFPKNRRDFPHPPRQPTDPEPGTCTRYYFTATIPAARP